MDSLRGIPRPTIDRPFAIELWPLFEKIYAGVVGYPPNKFVFVPGETAMSTLKATATMLAAYYVTVFAGREFMKKREPFKLNGLFMVHNLILTTISGTLLALFIEQLLPTVWKHGVFYAICDPQGGWTPPLVTLYYVSTLPITGIGPLKLIFSSSITLLSILSYWTQSSWFSKRSPLVWTHVFLTLD